MLAGQFTNHSWPNCMKLAQTLELETLYKPLIPIIYLQVALQIAQVRGLDASQLAQMIGLKPQQLQDGQELITPLMHAWLIGLMIEQSGENGLGFEIGLRLSPTVHGQLGQAMLCCASLRQALDIASRFWHLRERLIQFEFKVHHSVGVVHLQTEVAYPDPLRRIHFDCMLAMFYRVTQILTCNMTAIGEIWLDYPAPEDASSEAMQRLYQQLPMVRYNMPSCQYRVPLELLDQPLVMANPEALAQAIAQCEREQSLLPQQQGQFLQAINARLQRQESGYASPAQLASALHLSLRTFRRRLQQEGSSYQVLLDTVKQRDALQLLEDQQLSIQQISSQLGYRNPANFSRVFKTWTGKTPTEYRALLAGKLLS